MTPVDQTKFGTPWGNCHAACVASILGLRLDQVPSVCHLDDWFLRLQLWLGRHGMGHIMFTNPGGKFSDDPSMRALYKDHFLIAGGMAARGFMHSVVYRGLTDMVHDPHPDRTGITFADDFIWITISDPRRAAWLLGGGA